MIAVRLPPVTFLVMLGVLAVRPVLSAEQGSAGSVPSITVSGSAEVVVDPDRATLTIAVDTQRTTSASAGAENARITAVVTKVLLAAGVTRSDLMTANYTVQPQWQYPNNSPPRRIGYEATDTLRVSVAHLAALGKWIDAALGAGATRVESIEFDSSAAQGARREALAKAVANAREDAQTLAEAAGGKLGALQELSTVQDTGPRPLFRTVSAPGPIRVGEETHIVPSPLHISATVTGRWLFEQ